MSNYQGKMTTKNAAREGVVNQRRNNTNYENNRRLCNPVAKVTSFRREDYNSNTYQLSDRPNLKNINSTRPSYNPRQNNLLLNSNDSNQSSINYKFQSQTERLIICKKCGKPKRPKGMQGGCNTEPSKKSVIRQIIGEQNEKGEYIIRYADEQNMNNFGNKFGNQENANERRDIRTENRKIRGAPQPRFDEGFNANPNSQFCPIHGYI